MPSHQRHQLSIAKKVKLYLSLGCFFMQCLVTFLIKLIPRLAAGWSPSSILAVAYMRSRTWITLEQSRAIALPTGQSIAAFCKSAGLDCRSVDVDSSDHGPRATLHYIHITDRPKARLLFYFHGGAYVNPIDTKGLLPFALECARTAGASDLVCLEYTLAPELKYPGQLVQAVDALDYVLRTHHPSQILLGGESAGGHLVLSLLAHIQSPHPSVKALPGFGIPGQNILGAYVISPWVSMKYDSKSFKTNASRDYIRAKGMAGFIEMWNPNCSEVWGELLAGDVDFWRNLPVNNMLVTAGSWECFLTDILAMASRLQAKEFGTGAAVELSVGEMEVHVHCALDKAVGAPHRQGARNILSWLIRIVGVEAIKLE